MEGLYRKEGGARKLLAKERKDGSWPGHLPLGRQQGVLLVDCLIFLLGVEGALVTDYLIGTDQKTLQT